MLLTRILSSKDVKRDKDIHRNTMLPEEYIKNYSYNGQSHGQPCKTVTIVLKKRLRKVENFVFKKHRLKYF